MINGIKKIENFFATQKAFVAYLTAGDGGIDHTFEAAMALIEAGVNMLEIGVPFSEPIADGVVIQRAIDRSLKHGTTMYDVLDLVKKIRSCSDIPIILFSYLNPILVHSQKNFFEEAKKSGVDGLLLVDCPLEESEVLREKMLEHQIAPIYVIAPSTPPSRIQLISDSGKGFLYYACRNGTTGVKNSLPDNFLSYMQIIKQHSSLPVIVGFGISTREMAHQVISSADGVVVGSYIIDAMEKGATNKELTHLMRNINPF